MNDETLTDDETNRTLGVWLALYAENPDDIQCRWNYLWNTRGVIATPLSVLNQY